MQELGFGNSVGRQMKIEDKRYDVRLRKYELLMDGEWYPVSSYSYHAFGIGDTVPEYILERENE